MKPPSLRVLGHPAHRIRAQNPYTALLYESMTQHGVTTTEHTYRRLLFGHFDVWHLHWPHHSVGWTATWRAVGGLAKMAACLGIARVRGMARVWTVHNLHGHDVPHPGLQRLLEAVLDRCIDAVILLDASAEAALAATYPRLVTRPRVVVPHGHYRPVFPSPPDRRTARARLDVAAEDTVLLCPGRIRPYKAMSDLTAAFAKMPGHHARLVIAGDTEDANVTATLRTDAERDPRIHLRFGFLPEDELAAWIRACDVVVLPYRDVMNSGVALLALSLDRPVLASAKGAIPHLGVTVGSDWVRTFDGPLTGGVLADAVEWARSAQRADAPDLDAFDWALVGQRTAEALRRFAGLTQGQRDGEQGG